MSTFVTVGNAQQPFDRLLMEVARALGSLPEPVVVQCGHTRFSSDACEVVDFLNPAAYQAQIQRAQLLIMHAGAGSVLHALKAGRFPILVPRLHRHGEHVNDHQVAFARQLEQAGRALVVEDIAQLRSVVAQALSRVASPVPAGAQSLVRELRSRLDLYGQQLRSVPSPKKNS